MEWESIKKKWAEMTSRVQCPAMAESAHPTDDPKAADGKSANKAKSQLGKVSSRTNEERSTV